MSCYLVDILFSYERDASEGWEDIISLFNNPTSEQLAAKIGCSKRDVKALLDGYELHFKGKMYYLESYVIE